MCRTPGGRRFPILRRAQGRQRRRYSRTHICFSRYSGLVKPQASMWLRIPHSPFPWIPGHTDFVPEVQHDNSLRYLVASTVDQNFIDSPMVLVCGCCMGVCNINVTIIKLVSFRYYDWRYVLLRYPPFRMLFMNDKLWINDWKTTYKKFNKLIRSSCKR